MDNVFLTMDEVAKILGVSKATVKNYRKKGLLNCYKFSNKTIL